MVIWLCCVRLGVGVGLGWCVLWLFKAVIDGFLGLGFGFCLFCLVQVTSICGLFGMMVCFGWDWLVCLICLSLGLCCFVWGVGLVFIGLSCVVYYIVVRLFWFEFGLV